MNKVLVTGSNGQLGSELTELVEMNTKSKSKYFFTNKNSLDITNKSDIQSFIEQNAITHIINCAAYTAVDKAETDKINANCINHLAASHLATISKEYGLPFIHISTDYVFDGENHRPYIEDDNTSPNGVYGQTKLDGENAILDINPSNSIIIRTSWVYSSFGSNFVKTMLRLGKERDTLSVIFDQVGTPTYAKDLAQAVLDILPKIQNDKVEIYHYSNEGACSWYDFATSIFRLSNIDCDTTPIETKEYPTPAKRPHYSLLNKSKIKKEFDLNINHWEKSLIDCLKKLDV
jgi:dTDP-4-dehydrorhamnose reductase